MTSGRDDDALTWSGDDDPTLDVGPAPTPEPASADGPVLPAGFTALGKGSVDVGRADADGTVIDPGDPASMGNAMLIALGVFGGIYLLYAIGWIIGGLRLWVYALGAVPAPFFYATFAFAVAAPLLWFVTTLVLTRDSRPWLRIVWLIAGVLLLLPWPFLMVGAVGQ